MHIIGINDLFISQGYRRRYLRWATGYASTGIPDGMHPRGEFGVVAGDGTLRIIVPLFDDAGYWTASGLGPPCRPECWTVHTGPAH